MSETDFLTGALAVAQRAARAAGTVLESWVEKFTVREKSTSNLVTEADVAAQEVIFTILQSVYPDHRFLGEEGTPGIGGDSPHRWIVDPLDGTTNYVHRFPYYAVSIALESHGELAVGVIFDPNRDEMFSAIRGGGATLNGKPIRPSRVQTLAQSMLVASLPVAVLPGDPAIARFLQVINVAQGVQRTGSAALNLAYTASGRIDGFWSGSLKPWDVAAGVLLVEEAGGRTSTMAGGKLSIEVPDLLATNGSAIHEELQQYLK